MWSNYTRFAKSQITLSKVFYTRSSRFTYCYHSDNAITSSPSQSDHIKRLPLYFTIQVYKQATTSNTNGNDSGLNGCKMWFFSSNSMEEALSDLTTTIGTASIFSLTAIVYRSYNNIPLKNYSCFPYNLYELFVRLIWPLVVGIPMILLIYSRNKKMRSCLKSELSDYVARVKELF